MARKLSDLTTESAPASTDILAIADPATGIMRKITVSALKTYMDTLGGGDVTAPTVVSATAIDSTHIQIVFSESVTCTTAGWSFKKNGSALAITSVSGSGTTWSFLVATMAGGDTLLRSYNSATGATVDGSSNELVSFTDSAVTNSIGGVLEDLVFGTANGLSVSTTTWSGTDDGSVSYNSYGVATKSLAASTDGYVQAKYTDVHADGGIIGVDTDSTIERFASGGGSTSILWKIGAYCYGGTIYYFEDTVAITSSGHTLSNGHYWRINRTGSVWKLQSSTDGSAWTDRHTFAYTGTGQMYIKACIDSFTDPVSVIYEPKGYNVS